MRRKGLLIGLGGLVALLLAAPIAWYLISPLFITRAVDDTFPAVGAAANQPGVVGGRAVPAGSSPAPTVAVPTPVAATVAPSAAPTSAPTGSVPPASPRAAAQPTVPARPSAAPSPTATVAPSGPVVVRTGQFHDVEHEGSGTATIYRLPDGQQVLRLEGFSVLNGPDLYVYVSAAPDAHDAKTVSGTKYVSLGRLKGNKGNQNYDLPADLNLAEANSVVIWCQQFRVNFATAPLR